MSEQRLWKEIDDSINIWYLDNSDRCLFAREFKRGLGYQGGDTNQLILNFKKDGTKRNSPEWRWRNVAVQKFADELSYLFKPETKLALTSIPSSCVESDPKYDCRFEDLFEKLLLKFPKLRVENPIKCKSSVESAHSGVGTRKPAIIKDNYLWEGFKTPTNHLAIIDDVITTGGHFKAFTDFLKENGYAGGYTGVFWARTITDNSPSDLSE